MQCRMAGLIVTLALGLCCAPLAAEAQPARHIPRLGVLLALRTADPAPTLEAFRQGLRERGWVEGQNVISEYRGAEGTSTAFRSLQWTWSGARSSL